MSKITCLIKEPTKPIKFAEVENELHALQSVVDGFIEVHTINKHLAIVCNEEGRLERRPYCCTVDGIHFVGTVMWVGIDGEEFADLNLTIKELMEYIPADDRYKEDLWASLVD